MLHAIQRYLREPEETLASIKRGLRSSTSELKRLDERTQCLFDLLGRLAACRNKSIDQIETLADVEFRVYSQFGEDGIIDWLVETLGLTNKTFVEFGVENYREANTRFLLVNRNWTGLVIDGSETNIADLQTTPLYWRYDLQAVSEFITADNIKEILQRNGFNGPLGLLSIDLDGVDYWVLKELQDLQADILVVECNPVFGDRHSVTVAYDPSFERFRAHRSGLLFGASITALRELAESCGYQFLGTCSNGLNAFFVRSQIASGVIGKIIRMGAWPSFQRDSRDSRGYLSFVRGSDRYGLIADCEVFCCRSQQLVRLRDLGEPYSDEWLELMALPSGRRKENPPK